jgi:hypothetical protein
MNLGCHPGFITTHPSFAPRKSENSQKTWDYLGGVRITWDDSYARKTFPIQAGAVLRVYPREPLEAVLGIRSGAAPAGWTDPDDGIEVRSSFLIT